MGGNAQQPLKYDDFVKTLFKYASIYITNTSTSNIFDIDIRSNSNNSS